MEKIQAFTESVYQVLTTYKFITYPSIAIGIFIIAIIINKLVRSSLDRYQKFAEVDDRVDATKVNFLKNAIRGIIYGIAIMLIIYSIPELKSLGVTLFAGAGVFALIIGFASQDAFSNIVSGIFIVFFKPFRVNDIVFLDSGHKGVVEDITLRHTVIRNFNNFRVIIPNAAIANEVIQNAHIGDERICEYVEIGISYDSDIDLAMKIMREEALAHANVLDARSSEDKAEDKPVVNVRVVGLGDSSVDLRAYVWAKSIGDAFVMHCDLRKSIKERFDKEGVEIPFPHRTLVVKNPEDLKS